MSDKNRISIYAAGGLGVNVGAMLKAYAAKSAPHVGYAEMDVVMIDTSRSNLHDKSVEETDIYLVEGLDGSGSVRSAHHKKIAECVTDIMHRHPPGALSIVLSSLSGGSGSVIAPSLVTELLAKGHNVIVIGVASFESRKRIDNCAKTLQSYEKICTLHKKPITLFYLENNSQHSRQANDTSVYDTVLSLAILFSGQNHELDSSDLTNWLNYNNTTSFAPKLMYLATAQGTVATEKAFIVSVATLAEKNGDEGTVDTPEYRCIGYVPDNLVNKEDETPRIKTPFHYVILDGVIAGIYAEIAQQLRSLDESSKARRRNVASILDADDDATENGLIF